MASEQTDEPLSPEDARVLIGKEEADVIDIREDEDAFAEGHLAGAAHVPGGDREALPEDLSQEKTLILVCESGERSAELAAEWREDGRSVTSIEGGMEAWKSARMPVQPNPGSEFEGPDLRPPGT